MNLETALALVKATAPAIVNASNYLEVTDSIMRDALDTERALGNLDATEHAEHTTPPALRVLTLARLIDTFIAPLMERPTHDAPTTATELAQFESLLSLRDVMIAATHKVMQRRGDILAARILRDMDAPTV